MKYTYYCKYCNGQNVWVDALKHLNEPDTYAEYDTFYCGDCENELRSVGIREGEKEFI
jgi:predicted SprT family Zn-dependent metalloprotease